MARQRARRGSGGLTRKTGSYTANGVRQTYRYWQASREAPADAIGEGSGRKRVTGSGPTPAEAWRRCNANYDALIRGEPRRGKPAPSPRVSVRQLFIEWQATNEAGAVSPVMARKYRGYFDNHVLPHIGDRRLDTLTEADFTALFHRTLADKIHPTSGGSLLSEASRRNIFMALSGSLEFAIRAGYLASNPLKSVTPPKKSKPQDDIDEILAHVPRLIEAIQREGNPDEARHLLAFLGLRRSERLGLCWSDIRGVDTGSPRLRVQRQLARSTDDGRLVLKPHTKNGQDRTIVLAEPFIGALRRHRDAQALMKAQPSWRTLSPEYDDLIFIQANGYPIDQNDDNDDWNRLLRDLGIPRFRAHLTRHITAYFLSRLPNVPIATVMSIFGHSTQAMSVYYAHVEAAGQHQPMEQYGLMFTAHEFSQATDPATT